MVAPPIPACQEVTGQLAYILRALFFVFLDILGLR